MVFVMRKSTMDNGSFELWDSLTAQCYYYKQTSESNKFCGISYGKSSHFDIRFEDPICPLN